AFLVIIMIIFGSTGNLLVLMVVARCPTLKKSYNTFIASLSATDLLFNISIMPFYADSFYHRRWRFSKGLCMFHAFFGTVLIMCSSLHIALIAINRYFLVVHMSIYPRVSRIRILILQIVIVWLISIASVIPGAVGWHAVVRYTDQISRCTYVRSESKESLDIVFSMGFVLPSFVVFICYGLIWCKSKGSRKKLKLYKHPSQAEPYAPSRKRRPSQKRNTRKHSMKIIVVIFISFLFTYLPYSIINLADERGELNRIWYMSTSLFFWAGSCLNPYIYGIMNEQFRNAY
ncbi:hypothetical protein HELRODRAFT_122869, partial [Helobdella robusta]|uniref:G-protein coupled receptors family 1 profile domain-containing protein n=1 Tax=Helobdella robusta TaxID=6412 RepID=T1EGW2_HELRO